MPNREEIVRDALALPPEDRAYVADALEQSLAADHRVSSEIAEAWSKEIDRRIAAYDRGESKAVDFETSLAQVRAAFEAQRSAKSL